MEILAPRHSRQAMRKRAGGPCQKPTHESCRCFGFLGCLELCTLFPLTSPLCCRKHTIQGAHSPCQAFYWQNPMSSAACWAGKVSGFWEETNNLFQRHPSCQLSPLRAHVCTIIFLDCAVKAVWRHLRRVKRFCYQLLLQKGGEKQAYPGIL